ncbi:Ig-like domain-containing protein, partial [Calditrichota bacterium]
SEDSVNSTFNAGTGDNSISGYLHGIVMTNDTHKPVEDVTINYVVNGIDLEAISDLNGYYKCEKLVEGTYTFIFNSPDTSYSDWMATIDIQSDTSSDSPSAEDFTISVSKDIFLYHKNAKLQGQVIAQYNDEDISSAAGVPVSLTDMDGIINANYSTTTDEDGMYSFSNLPSIDELTVLAVPNTEEYSNFSFGVEIVKLIPGATVHAPNIILLPASEAIRVLANNFARGNFPTGDSLKLIFSRPIDEGSLNIVLKDSTDNSNVTFTFILSPDGKSLSILPSFSLATNSTYNITITGLGEDQTSFRHTFNFTTQKGIELLYSNIFVADNIGRNDFDANEPITITFSLPLNRNNPGNEVILTDDTGDQLLTDISYQPDNRGIEVLPNGGPLLGYTTYQIGFVFFSNIPGDSIDSRGAPYEFSTVGGQGALPGRVTGLVVNPNDGFTIDWNTSHVNIMWNALQSAELFEVYAKNSERVPNFILLGTLVATRAFGSEMDVLIIPPRFDWSTADADFTPFTNGVQITIKMRAVNQYGAGELSTELALRDNTAPGGYILDQNTTANNIGNDEPSEVRFSFLIDIEYCGNAEPQWEFRENGGDPAYRPSGGTWRWSSEQGYRNGELTVIIDASQNGSGDILRMNGVTDNSGNAQVDWVEYPIL